MPFAPLTKLSQMVRLTTKMDEPMLIWDRISHKNGTACSKFVLFYVYDDLHQFCFTIVISCKNKIHIWIPIQYTIFRLMSYQIWAFWTHKPLQKLVENFFATYTLVYKLASLMDEFK